MGRITMKSTDVLKWGFMSAIGRSAGKDVYNAAKKAALGDGTYVEDNVDESKLGAQDETGHFTYNGYKSISFWSISGWTLGMLILAPIFAPILFIRSLYRIIRKRVRFVDLYDCPVYKTDGRARYGRKLIGYQTQEKVYTKTYEEAMLGNQINNKPNDSVRMTKISNWTFLILSILGLGWFYYVQTSINRVFAEKAAEEEMINQKMIHWNDTIFADDFTGRQTTISYIFPTVDNEPNTDFVLVKNGKNLLIYSNYKLSYSIDKIDMKIYQNGEYKLSEPKLKYSYLDHDKYLHIELGRQKSLRYDRETVLPSQLSKNIQTCDSLFIRSENTIYKIVNKR